MYGAPNQLADRAALGDSTAPSLAWLIVCVVTATAEITTASGHTVGVMAA